jgi:tetratricopeptide (TPR) repeat protein
MNIGNVLQAQCDYGNALAHLQKALDINLKCLGPSHAAVATTYINMGVAHEKLGNLSDAAAMYQTAHGIRAKALINPHSRATSQLKNDTDEVKTK